MSTHAYPYDPAVSVIGAVEAMAVEPGLAARPVGVTLEGADIVFTFSPDLTPAQVTALTALLVDLRDCADLGLPLSLEQYRARKADVETLRTFLGLATPTQAQAVGAEKALIRVVGALVRLSLP